MSIVAFRCPQTIARRASGMLAATRRHARCRQTNRTRTRRRHYGTSLPPPQEEVPQQSRRPGTRRAAPTVLRIRALVEVPPSPGDRYSMSPPCVTAVEERHGLRHQKGMVAGEVA